MTGRKHIKYKEQMWYREHFSVIYIKNKYKRCKFDCVAPTYAKYHAEIRAYQITRLYLFLSSFLVNFHTIMYANSLSTPLP